MKFDFMIYEISKPHFTNKFTVCCQVLNFIRTKDGKKLINELDAFLGIGISFFRKK